MTRGKINKINKKLFMGEVSANVYCEVLSKYLLEVGPKFGSEPTKAITKRIQPVKT